jgi:hypothetical protein
MGIDFSTDSSPSRDGVNDRACCPLTEKQADILMSGCKYADYVLKRLKGMDESSCSQTFKEIDAGLTEKEIRRAELAKIKAEDKRILMSEGIAGLPNFDIWRALSF